MTRRLLPWLGLSILVGLVACARAPETVADELLHCSSGAHPLTELLREFDRLSGSSKTQAIAIIVRALDDSDPKVRDRAPWLLGDLRYDHAAAKGAIPRLLAGLAGGGMGEAGVLVGFAPYLGGDDVPVLMEALRNPKVKSNADLYRSEILGIIGKMGPEAAGAVPALGELAADPGFHQRFLAIKTLSLLGASARPAIPVLLDLLRSEDAGVRNSAADALRDLSPYVSKEAAPALRDALNDSQQGVREAITFALATVDPDDPENVARLRPMLRHWNPQVADRAARLLAGLGDPGAQRIAAQHEWEIRGWQTLKVTLWSLKYAAMAAVVFLPAAYRRRRGELMAAPGTQWLVLALAVGLCLAAYAFYNSAVTAAQMSYSRNSPEAILLPLTGGVLAYGQLRVLRDRVSLVRVLAAVLLAHAMVMGLKALGAEGLNGAVLEAQPLVRYAAIGNALMFDWRNALSLAVYEELLIYGVWIRGLAGSAIWKTAVVVCTTVVVLLIGVVMTLGMH